MAPLAEYFRAFTAHYRFIREADAESEDEVKVNYLFAVNGVSLI